MSSIIRDGDTYHGIGVFGRGVFTNDLYGGLGSYGGRTYVAQCKDGYACGLGVLTFRNGTRNGTKEYAEHGPDGQYAGRCLVRWTGGHTDYRLYERSKRKEYGYVYAHGYCTYKGEACAPDDPRLLALIAQVAPVEVRSPSPPPATRLPLAPKPSSDGSAGSLLPPQALAAAVATEVHPNAARRRWWLRDTTQQQQSTAT
jgi:hypothetical protein